ncbi:Lipoprotein-anchoring transpeptidase ErfK/SrfK [Methylobacterium phyllostachyos]|uniref:Lipoprotein-anchoring transpeptidase ErfK/SrfK n=1 Tax=Methylobacterium phyllostachyos TaxID=582672 RepID=A0A1G9Z6T8_9HYPH|nr:L,D-transpeptidase [Methylobacterium phyllostachyos]SDN17020.1 Lipoprotein-anchoring transpeptidase ErfK/SrfK [Methylobacterium phyllostachyos]
MSAPIRRLILAGLAGLAFVAPAHAQSRGPVAETGIDGFGDDGQLYQDQNGAFYVRRGGRYLPYTGRTDFIRPAPAAPSAPPPSASLEVDPTVPARPGSAVPPAEGLSPLEAAKAKAVLRAPDNEPIDYAKAYGPVTDDVFPIQAFNYKKMNPAFLRQEIAYHGPYEPGTIIVDPRAHQLTLVQENGRARRYGVGVGKQGFSWSGSATVNSKQAWPDWYPPKEMIARSPKLASEVDKLQSGLGVAGGLRNPLGARAMYLWQGNKDTLFRIHGTLEPFSIGKSVSSGCIRMINQDAIDLFSRVNVGTKVVVLN